VRWGEIFVSKPSPGVGIRDRRQLLVSWNENSRTTWNRACNRKWQLCARNQDRLHRSNDKKKEKSVRGAMNLLKWNAWKAPLSMPVESQLSDQRCCFSTISRYRNEAMMKLKSTMMISGWRYGDSVLILSQDTHSHMLGSISSVVDCLEIRSLPLETRKKGLLELISLSTCFNYNEWRVFTLTSLFAWRIRSLPHDSLSSILGLKNSNSRARTSLKLLQSDTFNHVLVNYSGWSDDSLTSLDWNPLFWSRWNTR